MFATSFLSFHVLLCVSPNISNDSLGRESPMTCRCFSMSVLLHRFFVNHISIHYFLNFILNGQTPHLLLSQLAFVKGFTSLMVFHAFDGSAQDMCRRCLSFFFFAIRNLKEIWSNRFKSHMQSGLKWKVFVICDTCRLFVWKKTAGGKVSPFSISTDTAFVQKVVHVGPIHV